MEQPQTRTLIDYLRLFTRRKWVLLAPVVVAPLVAVALSLSQPSVYSASADVLLTDAATGAQSPLTASGTPLVMQTEMEIATSPILVGRVLRASGVTDRSVAQLTSEVSFGSVGGANILRISVHDRDRMLATKLVNAYAGQYIQYRHELDTSFLTNTRAQIEARMASVRRSGQEHSPIYLTLKQQAQSLLASSALQTVNAVVLRNATGSTQIQPTPVRYLLVGVGLGLVLGIAGVFLWDAIDTRIRTADDIRDLLGQPLLGRLVAPPRRLREESRLVMVEDAGGLEAEGFRILRTNLDLVNAGQGAKLIMVTSAVQGEGKSTTTANLGMALARVGRRVIVVDLDLRRPAIDTLFGLPMGERGVTSVALDGHDLHEAIADVPIRPVQNGMNGNRSNGNNDHGQNGSNGHRAVKVIKVLASGPSIPDAGDFAGSPAVRSILATLREQADFVLVDTPPLLGVGETAALSAMVDGIILVTRVGIVSRPLLRETSRILESSPARKLGFVVTEAEREEHEYQPYGYGYLYQSRARAPWSSLQQSVKRGLGASRSNAHPSDPATRPVVPGKPSGPA
jgi:tyrosine-protein kinase